MLVTLKEILKIAEGKKNAVGAFNAVSFASLKAVIGAAEESDQPVVLQYAQCHQCYNLLEDIGPLMLKYAEKASVPVCVHLDHGEDIEFLKKALDIGFTGVMIDASSLPYDQNAGITAKTVEMARRYGASVEAEIGSMGRRETGEGLKTGADDETKIYTDPAEAKRFVEETGIDALACSFGTTHGIYLKAPRLDFGVVASVREAIGGKPIVMHGGSGVSPEDYRKAIAAGVRKINYFTYMDRSGALAVKAALSDEKQANPLFTELTKTAEAAMKDNVKTAIGVFSCR